MRHSLHLATKACSLLLLVVAFSGCQLIGLRSETDGINFTTDQRSYSPGDTVTLLLEYNLEEGEIHYNLCQSRLQKFIEETWRQVEGAGPCDDEVLTLEPGEQDTYSKELPDALSEGSYRYEIRLKSRGRGIYTNAFIVGE